MALPADVQATETFKSWREKHNSMKANVLDKTLNFSDVVDKQLARDNLGVTQDIEDQILQMTIALSKSG